MVYCKTCKAEVDAFQEERSGYTVCTSCGQILDQAAWSSEPTFTKEGGESTVAGHFVSEVAGSHGLGRISNGRIYGFQYDATEKAGSKGRNEIERLVDLLGIKPRDDVLNSAHRLYMLAVNHNFNRGRRTAHIAAAAIYIICRQEGQPFMLLDFSDVLQVNVFVLGAVFLQLCKILRLEEHAIMTRPVDPSLYLHRFADRMGFGSKMHQVVNTALRLISSMKRDWLQTGRRPAGICGAALYIAGHIHGFQISRADVIRIVHIGESTLEKRVSEFAGTNACALTAVEFEEHSNQLERDETLRLETISTAAALAGPLPTPKHGCEHIGKGGPAAFAHGMCKDCYMNFLKVTGGLDTPGANPPAFTAGQIKADEGQQALEGGVIQQFLPAYPGQGAETGITSENAENGSQIEADMTDALQDTEFMGLAQAVVPSGEPMAAPAKQTRAQKRKQATQQDSEAQPVFKKPRNKPSKQDTGVSQAISQGGLSTVSRVGDNQEASLNGGEGGGHDLVAVEGSSKETKIVDLENVPEDLSDLSDDDQDYFHSAAEVKLKGIVWTAMNQDYIEKQERKAIAEAQKQEKQEAQLLLEDGTQKPKKGRPRGPRKPKPEENVGPSETAADGVKKMLDAKKLSNKVNYENLDILFEDPKTSMPESPPQEPAKSPSKGPVTPSLDLNKGPKKKKEGVAKKKKEKEKVKVTFSDTGPEGSGQSRKAKSSLRSSALGSLKSSSLSSRRKMTLGPSQSLL